MNYLIQPPFKLTEENKKCPICGNKDIRLVDYYEGCNTEDTMFNIYCERCGCCYGQVNDEWQLRWMPDRKRGSSNIIDNNIDFEDDGDGYIWFETLKYYPKNTKRRARIRRKYNIKRKKMWSYDDYNYDEEG